MKLASKTLSSLLALFLFVPAAYAEDVPTVEKEDAPKIIRAKGARLWVPEGGFVEAGEGLYLNKSAALTTIQTLKKSSEEVKQLADDNTKLKQEVAQSWSTPVFVIVTVTGVVLGAVVAGVAVSQIKK